MLCTCLSLYVHIIICAYICVYIVIKLGNQCSNIHFISHFLCLSVCMYVCIYLSLSLPVFISFSLYLSLSLSLSLSLITQPFLFLFIPLYRSSRGSSWILIMECSSTILRVACSGLTGWHNQHINLTSLQNAAIQFCSQALSPSVFLSLSVSLGFNLFFSVCPRLYSSFLVISCNICSYLVCFRPFFLSPSLSHLCVTTSTSRLVHLYLNITSLLYFQIFLSHILHL